VSGRGTAIGAAIGAVILSAALAAAPARADAPPPARADAPPPARADTVRWQLTVEGGSEYDTNIHRLEVPADEERDVPGAALVRGGARLHLGWARSARDRLVVAGFGGAKLFGSDGGQGENVLVTAGDTRYERAIGERGATWAARGSFYDASNYRPLGGGDPAIAGRTFSTASAEAALAIAGPRGHRVTTHAGYRTFRYKPDADFDWSGEHYGVGYRAGLWRGDPDTDLDAASFDLDLAYRLERRGYTGRAYTNACGDGADPDPSCTVPTLLGRRDLVHAASAELVYTGDRVWTARYEAQRVDSNSYGQSLIRQRLELGLTTELYRELYLTARAALQLNTFLDPLLLARDVESQTFVTIEDENRNWLMLHLARALGGAWSVEARYALFGNEFATEPLAFRRQTFYLGAVYRYR
jgi:hypothetical protein